MKDLKIKAGNVASGLCLAGLLLAGCHAPNSSSPISSKRGIETLEMKPGEIPVWRKTGNLTLKPSGEVDESDFSSSIRVTKDKTKRTILASGNDVLVTARDTNLIIKGGCRKLVVYGAGNRIKCDFVREIAVKGENNRLTLDSVSKGTVEGHGNNVAWKKPVEDKIPEIDFKGVNNSMEHID